MVTKARFYILGGLCILGTLLLLLALVVPNHVYADASTLIGMVDNGDIYVKAGSVTAPWSYRLTSGENASQLQMYDNRIAFVDSNNNLWLKQGLSGTWYEEMGNVQSYALTENGLLVLQSGGDIWYKDGSSPTAQWDSNLIANDGSKVYLSPSQMVIIDTNGNLLGKELATLDGVAPEGPDGTWYQIAQNATQAAITDSRLVYIDNQQDVYGKDGPIWSTWWNNGELINHLTGQVSLNGTMYCSLTVTQSSQDEGCKPNDFNSFPIGVFGYSLSNFSMAPGVFVVNGDDGDGNTYLRGLGYSQAELCSVFINYSCIGGTYVLEDSSGWYILSTTGTEITTNQE